MFSDPKKNIEQFHIDPGMKVADLGSGSGYYSIAAAEAVGVAGKVYAIDVQKDLLSKLKRESEHRGIDNIEIIWGDIDETRGTTLRDQSVDRVIVANVLFQLEKLDSFVEEVKRILKPRSGKILVVDWSDSFSSLGPAKDKIVTPDIARTLFESAGFVFDRDIVAGEHHYGMVFKNL